MRGFFSKTKVFKHFWTLFPFPMAKFRNFLPQGACSLWKFWKINFCFRFFSNFAIFGLPFPLFSNFAIFGPHFHQLFATDIRWSLEKFDFLRKISFRFRFLPILPFSIKGACFFQKTWFLSNFGPQSLEKFDFWAKFKVSKPSISVSGEFCNFFLENFEKSTSASVFLAILQFLDFRFLFLSILQFLDPIFTSFLP